MEPRCVRPALEGPASHGPLAGFTERVGFFGRSPVGLINRMRWDEKSKAMPRFMTECRGWRLPCGAKLPPEWPVPQLRGTAGGKPAALAAANGPSAPEPAGGLGHGSVGRVKNAETYYRKPRGGLPKRGFLGWF